MTGIIERLRAKTVLETYKDGSQMTLAAHPLGVEAADIGGTCAGDGGDNEHDEING